MRIDLFTKYPTEPDRASGLNPHNQGENMQSRMGMYPTGEEYALITPAVDRWVERAGFAAAVFAVLWFGGHIAVWWMNGCPMGR